MLARGQARSRLIERALHRPAECHETPLHRSVEFALCEAASRWHMSDPLIDRRAQEGRVPGDAMRLYGLCWQLETWLRDLVYVEIRALSADWGARVAKTVDDWPPASLSSDKKMTHMLTPHRLGISYLTFGQLWSVISEEDNWPSFADYFPPKDNAEARIKEVKSIRNRVAHFRAPHPNDLDRLLLFLKDMESGLRRFCERYTNRVYLSGTEAAEEPVSCALQAKWERIGYGVEMSRDNGGWLYAPGRHRMNPPVNATLSLMMHTPRREGRSDGLCYGLHLVSHQRQLNAEHVLQATQQVHSDVIHVALIEGGGRILVTIPGAVGPERVVAVVSAFLSACVESLHSSEPPRPTGVARPEYVLTDDHPLVSYDGSNSPVFDYDPLA